MRFRSLCLALACAIPAAAGFAEKIDLSRVEPVPADRPVPIQDFFRPLMLRSPQLNDSGTRLAAVVSLGQDKTALMIANLEKPEEEPIFVKSQDREDIVRIVWLTDTRLLAWQTQQKYRNNGVMVVNLTGRAAEVYPLIEMGGAGLVSVPDGRETMPLFHCYWDIAGKEGQVVEFDTSLDTSKVPDGALIGPDDWDRARRRNAMRIKKSYPEISTAANEIEVYYLADKFGELMFGQTFNRAYFKGFYLRDGDWVRSPLDVDLGETGIGVIEPGDKPGEVIALGPRRPGQPRVLQYYDAITGTPGEVLLEDTAYDFTGWVIRHPKTHALLGLSCQRTVPTTIWFSDEYKQLQAFLDAKYPGEIVSLWPADETGKNYLICVYSDRHPGIYYRLNIETRQLGLVKNSAPWIDPKRMRPMSMFKFKTAEGAKLDAYLTLPEGASKEHPVPMVVMPHGGPYARDTWGFDKTAQFLASRGYAVLQPNYRGSSGTDWAFPFTDRWDYVKMHADVTAATRAAFKTGVIDKDRVAIMGGSFGGYLSIMGVTHEPGLYRCAVTIAGVFDYEKLMADAKWERNVGGDYYYFARFIGDPKENRDRYVAMSPINLVSNIRVPVFVSHDRDDLVVEVGQSKDLIAGLVRNNIPHEVMLTSDQGHGTAFLEQTVEQYARILAFLEKNMAPRAASAAAPAK